MKTNQKFIVIDSGESDVGIPPLYSEVTFSYIEDDMIDEIRQFLKELYDIPHGAGLNGI